MTRRSNKNLKNTAVLALTSAALAGGALLSSTAPAQADPASDYGIYASREICYILNAYPNADGFYYVASEIMAKGLQRLPGRQAIGSAVAYACPWHAGWIIDLAQRTPQPTTSLR